MTVTKPEPVSQGKARLTSAIALLVWFGVVLQLVLSLQLAAANGKSIGQGLIVYFGFFTVLTNILVSLTLTWPLAAPHSRLGQFFAHASVRAGVAAKDVDQVFMTGGTSFVPAVRRIFDVRFGAEKIRAGGEMISVATGLALRSRDA